MTSNKLSITLPEEICEFLHEYQKNYHVESKSEVIRRALIQLRECTLEEAYKAANTELNNDFDVTTGDGINNEAW